MTNIHRVARTSRGITALCALITVATAFRTVPAAAAPRGSGLARQPKASALFEPNMGQAPASVRFLSRGASQNLLVGDDGVWFQQAGSERVGLIFAGAARLAPVGVDRLPGASNYHLGGEAAGSAAAVPHFARVRSPAVYPSIDLVVYAHEDDLEYDLVVAPGGDPRQIRLRFPGASGVTLDASGDLVIETPSATVRHGRPRAYQLSPSGHGVRQTVAAHYQVHRNGEIGIALAQYDRGRALVIDPVLSSTKRIGGAGNEQVTDIAVDGSGNVYVTGFTEGRGFPTLNGYQTTIRGDVDAFVAKYNSSGTLIYSTYYGGNGEDVARAIAVDGGGRAYVVGSTKSTNLAVVNAFQGSKPAGECAFLLVLSAAGNGLAYATYLGTSETGGAGATAVVKAADVGVGADGTMWVTGHATNHRLPFALNGFQTTHGGGTYDVFVMRVNTTNGAVPNFTYFGGSSNDYGRRLVRRGSDFVVGGDLIDGTDDRVNLGLLGPGGGRDAFVLAMYGDFSYGGGVRVGGAASEFLRGLAVDSSRNIYLSGETTSGDLPSTSGAGQPRLSPLQTQHGQRPDAFVTKLNANGTSITYLTYLGGLNIDVNSDLAVSSTGTAYVTGTSYSSNFPTVPSATAASQRNGFVTQVSSTGGFAFSALLGGSAADDGTAVAVSGSNLWIGGTSLSSSFPGAPGTLGGWDALLTKMTLP